MSAALERRVGQCDARLRPAADYFGHPPTPLLEDARARNQRGSVPVRPQTRGSGCRIAAGWDRGFRNRNRISARAHTRRRHLPACRSWGCRGCCRAERALARAARRAPSRNCCPGGPTERSVRRPRTSGCGPMAGHRDRAFGEQLIERARGRAARKADREAIAVAAARSVIHRAARWAKASGSLATSTLAGTCGISAPYGRGRTDLRIDEIARP